MHLSLFDLPGTAEDDALVAMPAATASAPLAPDSGPPHGEPRKGRRKTAPGIAAPPPEELVVASVVNATPPRVAAERPANVDVAPTLDIKPWLERGWRCNNCDAFSWTISWHDRQTPFLWNEYNERDHVKRTGHSVAAYELAVPLERQYPGGNRFSI